MDDDPHLSSFAHADAFIEKAATLIALDLSATPTKQEETAEAACVASLCATLDEYQEQSYLLDPSLDALVTPLILALRSVIRQPAATAPLATPRTNRLARLVYFFTKVRGDKAIVRFFPHEVADLISLLNLVKPPSPLDSASWELRYLVLLWLSVACRLPFNLDQLQGCAEIVPLVGYNHLTSASKERDGARAVLARYYSRQDVSLDPFLLKCEQVFPDPTSSGPLTSGLLEALCEILKTASPTSLASAWPRLYRLLAFCDEAAASTGAIVAKHRVKFAGRLALLRLASSTPGEDVPEEVEVILQETMEALQHKDTIVRWSASKYIARITEALPEELALDVCEAMLSSFEASFDDGELSQEHGLQGACFAFGELSRRGRVPPSLVDRLVACVLQALLFDRKRGVQSIGAGVRDSAAYVLWSLARSLRPEQAAPHATQLATRLVCVALFDRDIHIRRAASAAFQESVGRWGVLPQGIDVLRKIDFFTISVRRRAYLEAAPLVAENEEYRPSLVKHITELCLSHYDPEIRTLAASSLELIVRIDPAGLAPALVENQISQLSTKDVGKLHGLLLSLAALAAASSDLPDPTADGIKHQIFTRVSALHSSARSLRTSPLVLSAALQALEQSATTLPVDSSGWRAIVKLAGDRLEEEVHQQAATTLRKLSTVLDCSEDIDGLLADLNSRSATRQQCAAVVLGRIDFSPLPHQSRATTVVDRLVSFMGPKAPLAASTVEARRNAVESLSLIICSPVVSSSLSPPLLLSALSALSALLTSFTDYTVDQRGDVGSWVRISAISAVPRLIETPSLVGQEVLDKAVASLVKQAVERLDNVREVAGMALVKVGEICAGWKERDGGVELKGAEVIAELSTGGRHDWRDLSWASSHLLPLLAVEEYRFALLEGAVLAAVRHSASSPLLDFASSLPLAPSSSTEYNLLQFVQDLTTLAKKNFSSNRIFVPALGVLSSLMEVGCFEGLDDVEGGDESLKQILQVATRSLAQIKSAPRLTATSKIVVGLLSYASTRPIAADKIGSLLTHPSAPWLRQEVAEELIGVVGADGESELETLLLESTWADAVLEKEAMRVAELLRESIE